MNPTVRVDSVRLGNGTPNIRIDGSDQSMLDYVYLDKILVWYSIAVLLQRPWATDIQAVREAVR